MESQRCSVTGQTTIIVDPLENLQMFDWYLVGRGRRDNTIVQEEVYDWLMNFCSDKEGMPLFSMQVDTIITDDGKFSFRLKIRFYRNEHAVLFKLVHSC